MKVKIFPSRPFGEITAPPSKSMAHRLLICAAMAKGESRICGVSHCDDVLATIECLSTLGAKFKRDGEDITVSGIDILSATPEGDLFCRESGSTLRMLIPMATLSGCQVLFGAKEGLLRRPMTVYEKLYSERGLLFAQSEGGFRVKGALTAGEYTLPGDISSQFISGLIFALAALDGESTVHITPPFESRSYVEMTLEALRYFSAEAYFTDSCTVKIAGGGYKCCDAAVEGDYSGAAFPEALNLLGGEVTLLGLSDSSRQGDRIYREYFEKLRLGTSTLDIGNCPDLGPVLFALAAALNGATFTGTARLKIKESDRAAAMAEELAKLGGRVHIYENSVTVEKASLTAPTEPILSHGDHRIVMAMAILLTLTGGEIEGASAVDKSYPHFFRDLKKLNINLEIYD